MTANAAYEPFGSFLVQPTATNPSVTDRGFTGHRHNNLALSSNRYRFWPANR